MKSLNKPLNHDPARRATILAATYVGLQTAVPSAFATSLPPPPYTFEELIATANSIVVAKIHRFLYGKVGAIDDFKPAAEVTDPMRAVLEITIKEVLAFNPDPGRVPPAKGPALIFIGGAVTERALSFTPYPAAIGQEVILLLHERRRSTSTDIKQPPIYLLTLGRAVTDQVPLPLSRLKDVMAAALKAGLIQPK